MTTLLIRGGRIIDPATGTDAVGDLFIRDGVIAHVPSEEFQADRTIDAAGLIVCPGLIDAHVALREPGFDEDETIQSGTAAALAGGFTTIGALPDTSPPVDNRPPPNLSPSRPNGPATVRSFRLERSPNGWPARSWRRSVS